MNKDNDTPGRPSMKDRVKKVASNRKVQLGATIAVTAVVTTVLARSSLFETKYTLDEVGEIVNDVLADNGVS